MAEEIDDNGFFREDFSAESDWEVFNAQLCDLFQKWELSSTVDWGSHFDGKWLREEELMIVLGKQITIQYYRKTQLQGKQRKETTEDDDFIPYHEDLLCQTNTLGAPTLVEESNDDTHYLARMYGLRRFVVMKPTLMNKYLTKTSKFNFFLSSISVCAAEVCSAVPIFLQIYDPKWNFYLGVGMSSYMRTNFDLIALEQAPQEYLYLSGLVKMFKEKLPRSHENPAVVSVRQTYAMDTIKLRVPMYVPFGMTPIVDEERSVISASQFFCLPHGYFPVSNTQIFAVFTWPELADNMIIDSERQTQFVPSKAPCGSLYQIVQANSYLAACLKDYYSLMNAKNTLESYVGALSTVQANPLDQFSQKHFAGQRTSKQHAESGPTQKKVSGPMKEYELNSMLYYLLPDMNPEMILFPYELSHKDKIDPHRIKSAEADSLVHRLSCLLATCHAHFGGKSGLAQMYASFTAALRFLWDCCIPIPGVANGLPDTKTCLLHQKLQLLNVCIEKRLQREKGIQPKQETEKRQVVSSDDDADEDDDTDEEEFYDMTDDEESDNIEEQIEDNVKTEVSTNAEGRLKRFKNLRLLDSEEYMYLPVTQDLPPKTEDQLQDDTNAVLKLGSDSEFITDMMCSTVVSDAEAFKAANPNARFEDFIRWFSPNDWEEYVDVESGEKKHKLSIRMQAAGNTWQQVWEQAKPVPAAKQKRLFDDTQEGYKILNYLESRNLADIFGLTLVPLLHSAVLKLKHIFTNSQVLELFNESIDEILADLSRFSRDVELIDMPVNEDTPITNEFKYTLQLPNPQPIWKKIEQLERHFYQYKCFELMPDVKEMNIKQIQKKFREILQNNGNCSIDTMQQNSKDFYPKTWFEHDMRDKLLSKDYVIRLGEGLLPTMERIGEREKQPVKLMPQFMRAIVTGEKLRLCGAFTENTTFLD